MKLIVLGSGGAIPTIQRNLPAYLIKRNGESFLFDCGEGTQKQLMKSKAGFGNLNNIFISHLHVDHLSGLHGLLMTFTQVNFDKKITIYGPTGISNFIQSIFSSLNTKLNYELKVVEVNQGVIYKNKDFTISAFKLKHSVLTFGYCFCEKDRAGKFNVEKAIDLGIPKGPLFGELQQGRKIRLENDKTITPDMVLGEKRKGRKIVIAVDTLVDSSFSEIVTNADLLLFDGMFASDFEEESKRRKHATIKDAAQFAKKCNVKELILTHISPRYRYKDIDRLKNDYIDIFPTAKIAFDLMEIEIPFSN